MNPSLSVTSYLGGARLPDALEAGGFTAPDVSALLARLTRSLRLASRDAVGSAQPAADQARAQIDAIRSYAEFVRQHPDMPTYHRERCLDSALRECRRLERTIARSGGFGETRVRPH